MLILRKQNSMAEPLKLYTLEESPNISPITKQDVYDTISTSLNMGNNRISPSGIVSRNVVLGQKTFYIAPSDEGAIQRAINILSQKGGGTLHLTAGTYNVATDTIITVPSNINIVGDSASLTIIDFLDTSSQLSLIGSNAYSTGTVSITNSDTAVVGVNTVWTSAMVGRKILLQDFWYTIDTFVDTTNITIKIDEPYIGTTLSGSVYVIATPIESTSIKNITFKNSVLPPIDTQYFNNVVIENVYFFTCTNSIYATDGSALQILGCLADTGTLSISPLRCHAGIIFNTKNIATAVGFSALADSAFYLESCRNWSIVGCSTEGSLGSGFVFDACTDIRLSSSTIASALLDGVTLVGASTGIIITGNSIKSNTEYGVTIPAASSDNIVSNNVITSNTLGQITDTGTSTVVIGNVGV